MIINLTNPTGSELAFKVVGGITAPVNPKENMLWIHTSELITNYILSESEPVDPIPGTVWIIIGTSGTAKFNALKKNALYICPLKAKHYISETWLDVPAQSYQSGEWVDWWNGQLYTSGNEWKSVTGGWAVTALKSYSGTSIGTAVSPTIIKNDTSMEITTQENSNASGVLHCVNKIDLSDYNTLTFGGNFVRGGSNARNLMAGCWESLDTYYETSAVVSTKPDGGNIFSTITVNVSGLSGSYYVGIGITASGSSAEIEDVLLS